MRTRLHRTKEEERAAIEKEIAAISVDLERLRTIIQCATAAPQVQEEVLVQKPRENTLEIK